MEQVNIQDAKAHFSRYIELAAAGQDLVIARKGKPVARLTAVEPKPGIRFGVLKGKVRVADDFDGPLPDEVLAGFEGR
jgi:prevent-host-death family protein